MPSVVAEVGSTANNYQIIAKLAMGGMAEIFLARGASAAGVERYVVLKRIIRDRANDTHFVQMFLEEARLAAQLQHANIAQVYDIGKLGDSYFFTMEYVHGETVRGLIQRARSLRRELPLHVILTVIAGAAAGLHHAHERIGIDGRPLGIVHRDVSPSNLMISYDGSVKVVDFGVAKAENRAQETRSGAVKGKISYLSPEQCRGTQVDRRSDLFSLGIVLWEMLTTERLYRRASDFENMAAIVNEPPAPPSRHRAGLPLDLEQLSLRLLAKTGEERFATADELVETIEAIAARNGIVLSVSALGRFMKELFGQRPEPWVEMEVRDTAEGVTVTSEPLPPELSVVSDPVEGQLQHVRDLSERYAAQHGSASGSLPREANPPSPTANLRAVPPPSGDVLAGMPLYQMPLPAPPLTEPGQQPVYPVASAGWSSHVTASSSSSSYPQRASQPTASAARGLDTKLIASVAGASLAVAVVVWIATRGGDASDESNVTAPVATVAPDAAIDAATVAAPPIDAPAVIPIAPDPLAQLRAAIAEGRSRDALATCIAGISDDLAAVCTLAACAASDAVRAKQWLAKSARGERPALIAECKTRGIELAGRPKPPKPPGPTPTPDPCKTDPMACQR
ncbi:MAG: protein kinase [Deltaproteobacteria bacterium]|nr:protein kinase [Deltaproteobacteria bacterium]